MPFNMRAKPAVKNEPLTRAKPPARKSAPGKAVTRGSGRPSQKPHTADGRGEVKFGKSKPASGRPSQKPKTANERNIANSASKIKDNRKPKRKPTSGDVPRDRGGPAKPKAKPSNPFSKGRSPSKPKAKPSNPFSKGRSPSKPKSTRTRFPSRSKRS